MVGDSENGTEAGGEEHLSLVALWGMHGLGQSWPLTLRALLWYLTAFLVSDTALST